MLNRWENLFLPMMAIRIATFLPCFVLGEELLAAGKAIWLEEEAEDDGPVGRHRLVPVAGRPPGELTGSARALVILEGALPLGDSASIEVTDRDPDAAYVAAFREALADRGISIDGIPSDAWPWVALLAVFALLFTAIGMLAFGPLLEEA